MDFLQWTRGVAVSASTLIGTCYGHSWNISLLDPCEEASAHLVECLSLSKDCGDTDCGGDQVACENTTLCTAECINDADCDEIEDAFSGNVSSRSKTFLDCVTFCAGVQ